MRSEAPLALTLPALLPIAAAFTECRPLPDRFCRRSNRTDLPGDRPIPGWSSMRRKVEHLGLALQTAIEVAVGDNKLIGQPLGLGDDLAIGVDDAGAADQARAVFAASLGNGDSP